MSASPLSLDAVEVAGATRFGSPLAQLIMVHSDGRRVTIDLPRAFIAPPSTLDEERRGKIVAFFAPLPGDKRVKGQDIANAIGEELAFDSVRKLLGDMVDEGILCSRQGVAGYWKGPNFPTKTS